MIPEPYALILLALAAARGTRLIGWDSITDPIRSRITGHHHGGHKTGKRAGSKRDRPTWMLFLTCPWCLGAHVSAYIYIVWVWQPHWTLVILTPFAISEIVGLMVKNLDS